MARKRGESGQDPKRTSLAARRRARREGEEPLEARVTLRFRFGEAPEDRVTMLDDRAIPMFGSVFQYRDRIVRSFAMRLLRAGVTQPKVVAEIVPGTFWMLHKRRAAGQEEDR